MMRKGDGGKVNAKQQTLTRARARETPSENENRVEQIASLMRAGDWQRGKTGPLLAAQWRLSETTIKRLSAEASRRVIREVTDPRTVTETVATVLSANVERASEERKYGEVARLADVWTRIVGARAPERVDVTVQTFASLPPATLLERVREQIRELRELERQLCEQLAITVHSEGTG